MTPLGSNFARTSSMALVASIRLFITVEVLLQGKVVMAVAILSNSARETPK